jgi:hypothetical protein
MRLRACEQMLGRATLGASRRSGQMPKRFCYQVRTGRPHDPSRVTCFGTERRSTKGTGVPGAQGAKASPGAGSGPIQWYGRWAAGAKRTTGNGSLTKSDAAVTSPAPPGQDYQGFSALVEVAGAGSGSSGAGRKKPPPQARPVLELTHRFLASQHWDDGYGAWQASDDLLSGPAADTIADHGAWRRLRWVSEGCSDLLSGAGILVAAAPLEELYPNDSAESAPDVGGQT